MTSHTELGHPEETAPALHRFIGVESAPEFYADAINVNTSLYGTSIHFGTRAVTEVGIQTRLHGVLRISPQMTKVLAAILMKQVRSYEKDVGRIPIPSEVAKSTGVSGEIRELEGGDGS